MIPIVYVIMIVSEAVYIVNYVLNETSRELVYVQMVVDDYHNAEIRFTPILVLLPSYRNSDYKLMITYECEEGRMINDAHGATCYVICAKTNEVEYVLQSDFLSDKLFPDNKHTMQEIREIALESYPFHPWPITYMDILPTTPHFFDFEPIIKIDKQPRPYWLHVKLDVNENDDLVNAKWGLAIARYIK